jgi:O-succinylbenzoic acid--CoA ligase
LYHVGGLSIVWRSALYGTAVALPPPRPSFDPGGLWDDLHRLRASLISLVPTMLYRLLQAVAAPPPAFLRVALIGGAAAGPEVLNPALARGWPLALTYGLTEATSQVATAAPPQVRRKPGSVGRPLLFTQVSVRDDAGRPLPAGQVGEIWVRGPVVFAGYWPSDAAATPAVFVEGWLRTRDAGYLDADGDLWVLARRADLIVTGGENVTPQEVEAVLRQHPAVADAAVVGLPDPEWGQIVAAAVVPQPERSLSPEDLQAYCRTHLAGYKIPRRFVFVDALPRTASGKLRRAAVRALFDN